jgi:hydroxyacylglutathione hydrolase
MRIVDDLHAFLWTDPATNNPNTYLINGTKKIMIDPGHAQWFGVEREELKALDLSPSDLEVL